MDFQPDVLAGFSAAPIDGITLVRPDAAVASPRAAVLHVHGYNDYFYQAELAKWFGDRGLAFYAVDMRRSGRSLKPGDHPHDMADIAEQGDTDGSQHGKASELTSRLNAPKQLAAPSTNGAPTNGEAIVETDRPSSEPAKAPQRPADASAFDDELERRLDAAASQGGREAPRTQPRKRGRPRKDQT